MSLETILWLQEESCPLKIVCVKMEIGYQI